MGLFHDRMLGPEMVAALNQLYAAFAASAYPPGGGMFPPGTLAAPSVRGTADPATGWNFLNGEAQLSVGGVLKARATAAGLLDAAGNPLLSAGNAVGSFSDGAVIEQGSNANGDFVMFADGTFIASKAFLLSHSDSFQEWLLPMTTPKSNSLCLIVTGLLSASVEFKYTARYGSFDGVYASFNYSTPEPVGVVAKVIGRWK